MIFNVWSIDPRWDSQFLQSVLVSFANIWLWRVGAVLGMLNGTTSGPPPAMSLPATLAPRPPFCGANRLLYANRTLVDVCVFVCLFAWLFVLLPVFSHCFYKRKVLFIMRIKWKDKCSAHTRCHRNIYTYVQDAFYAPELRRKIHWKIIPKTGTTNI